MNSLLPIQAGQYKRAYVCTQIGGISIYTYLFISMAYVAYIRQSTTCRFYDV